MGDAASNMGSKGQPHQTARRQSFSSDNGVVDVEDSTVASSRSTTQNEFNVNLDDNPGPQESNMKVKEQQHTALNIQTTSAAAPKSNLSHRSSSMAASPQDSSNATINVPQNVGTVINQTQTKSNLMSPLSKDGDTIRSSHITTKSRNESSEVVEDISGNTIAFKLWNFIPIPVWWSNTYVMDWAAIVLCAIILIVLDGPIDWMQEYPINMADIHIQHPLHADTVTMIMVGAIVIIPCVLLAIFFWLKRRDMFEDMHSFALVVIAPIVFAYVVWVIIGNATGELRPDFLARCAPACMENFTWTCAPDPSKYAEGACDLSSQKCCPVQCGMHDDRYPEMLNCSFIQNGEDMSQRTLQNVCSRYWDRPVTEAEADCQGYYGGGSYSQFSIHEGYRAMPSGHTQVLFNCATTWWLYLAGKLQVYGRGVQQRTFCYGYLLISVMFVVATYVAMTRLNDMKHSFLDVFIGAFIGFCTSLLVYPLYYQNPTLGGEPLRRPKNFTIMDVLRCRKQDPWPAANTHLAHQDYSSSAFAPPRHEVDRQESTTLLSYSEANRDEFLRATEDMEQGLARRQSSLDEDNEETANDDTNGENKNKTSKTPHHEDGNLRLSAV